MLSVVDWPEFGFISRFLGDVRGAENTMNEGENFMFAHVVQEVGLILQERLKYFD